MLFVQILCIKREMNQTVDVNVSIHLLMWTIDPP
jgi:hypothetical protein